MRIMILMRITILLIQGDWIPIFANTMGWGIFNYEMSKIRFAFKAANITNYIFDEIS